MHFEMLFSVNLQWLDNLTPREQLLNYQNLQYNYNQAFYNTITLYSPASYR